MEAATTKPLEELIAEAIGLGRCIAARADALHLGGTALTAGLATRILTTLARGEGFDAGDDSSLTILFEIFEEDVARETTGKEICLVDPLVSGEEDCFVWCEVPILTDRGRKLQDLRDQLVAYIKVRDLARDRLQAENYLLRRLRG